MLKLIYKELFGVLFFLLLIGGGTGLLIGLAEKNEAQTVYSLIALVGAYVIYLKEKF